MKQNKSLLQQRIHTTWTKATRIITLIASGGGTPLVLGILLIGFYIAYQTLLTELPATFPFDWVVWGILTYILSSVEFRPWIEKADLVFLLPLEHTMPAWRKTAFLYSAGMAMVRLIVVLFLLYPLYRVRIGTSSEWWMAIGMLLALQIWTLWVRVMEDHRRLQGYSRVLDQACLWGVTAFLVFWSLHPYQIYTLLALLLPIVHSIWLYKTTKTSQMPWMLWQKRESLIRHRWQSLASWFVELRGVEPPIKKRTWLIALIKRFTTQKEPFTYLYWRTLIRRSDLFASFYRIWIWATLFVVSLPYPWVSWTITPLAIGLFVLQMPRLITQQTYPLWVKLYPVSPGRAVHSWVTITRTLAFLLGFLLIIMPLAMQRVSYAEAIILLLINWAIGLLIIGWNKRKLSQSSQVNR
ncbi:ABC transporter permease [Baia soyae]|uniref:Putative ABC-type exoprotein transport system permease subunit n=1 Tax=Baia soyae TaxID=1544746 RepID=A0A4R2S830_9BACL|nr:ABC transporter permease [Baia soyae]TCP68561.1 putative ABC-type exoprotein transport system permease subunit [Baia soyae]